MHECRSAQRVEHGLWHLRDTIVSRMHQQGFDLSVCSLAGAFCSQLCRANTQITSKAANTRISLLLLVKVNRLTAGETQPSVYPD